MSSEEGNKDYQGTGNQAYEEIFKKQDMFLLEKRRLKRDTVALFKLLKGSHIELDSVTGSYQHEFDPTPGGSGRQEALVCSGPWCHEESDTS